MVTKILTAAIRVNRSGYSVQDISVVFLSHAIADFQRSGLDAHGVLTMNPGSDGCRPQGYCHQIRYVQRQHLLEDMEA